LCLRGWFRHWFWQNNHKRLNHRYVLYDVPPSNEWRASSCKQIFACQSEPDRKLREMEHEVLSTVLDCSAHAQHVLWYTIILNEVKCVWQPRSNSSEIFRSQWFKGAAARSISPDCKQLTKRDYINRYSRICHVGKRSKWLIRTERRH
jgi:hypothetical protein